MNKIFTPDKPLSEPMERVLLDLYDSGRSHIVLAVDDYAPLRREVMAELGERLTDRYALYEFDYARAAQLSLPRFRRTPSDELPICVFAYGLEELKRQDSEKYETAIDFLNAHREDIRDTKNAVILSVCSHTHADLLRCAPDFADWRTADAAFVLSDGRRVEEIALGKLSITEAEHLRRQASRFEAMLERPNLEPAMKAEFHKQLALVRKQFGQDEERVFVKLTATRQRRMDGREIGFAKGENGPFTEFPFKDPTDGGRCAVLLDGLDEVADPLKRARIAEASSFFLPLPGHKQILMAFGHKGQDTSSSRTRR